MDGKRSEVTAKSEVDPRKWNAIQVVQMGTKEDIKTLNAYLDILEQKLFKFEQWLSGCY